MWAATSSRVTLPSRRPRVKAKPELVVARALKPRAVRTFAEPASQAFAITKASPSWSARSSSPRCLDELDVYGLGSLVAGLGVIGDLRTLGERLVAVADDAGVVHEEILARIVGRDEAEALLVAEPLHGSGCHVC